MPLDPPTAHARMAALRFANEEAPGATCVAFVPPGDAWARKDEVLFVFNGTTVTTCDAWEGTIDAPIPYNEHGVLVVGYIYRDAGNNKRRSSFAIEGAFSRRDLGLLMGALMGGDDSSFIPHQVGMPDLQQSPDFDADDHVWHTCEAIGWRGMGTCNATWSDIQPLFEARALLGYDVGAALANWDVDA